MDPASSTLNEETNKEPQAVVVRREPERELIKWKAPSRPYKARDRQFFVTVFAIAGIVSLILFLAEGLMPVLLVVALVFLYYVMATVPPEDVEYMITSKGVKIGGKLTAWHMLDRFWFIKKLGKEELVFETGTITGRLEMVIDPDIKEKIRKEVSAYVPEDQFTPSGLEKVTNWVAEKLPGNNSK